MSTRYRSETSCLLGINRDELFIIIFLFEQEIVIENSKDDAGYDLK